MTESEDKLINQDSQCLCLIAKAITAFKQIFSNQYDYHLQLGSQYAKSLFRNYTKSLECLIFSTKVPVVSRAFRNNYTSAYRALYSEEDLGYIPEIFSSAQQACPSIVVNGEYFCFSSGVMEKGNQLVQAYFIVIRTLKKISLIVSGECKIIPKAEKEQLRVKLLSLDWAWVNYEQEYISELIQIGQKSKEKLMALIQSEQSLTQFENGQKLKGKIFLTGPEYDQHRRKICEMIAAMNSIANTHGTGRDDLTYDILIAAEKILTKITVSQSKPLRAVAENIRESFNRMREMLRFFGEHMQMVDPQLKNNPELVEVLVSYEQEWTKGKHYFLEGHKFSQLIAFAGIVQAAKDKYPEFAEMMECSQPDLFLIIPCLIILRSLENEDEGLAESFLQNMEINGSKNQYQELKQTYLKLKTDIGNQHPFAVYNMLEGLLIRENNQKNSELLQITTKVRQLAVRIERVSPLDWNDMLKVLLYSG